MVDDLYQDCSSETNWTEKPAKENKTLLRDVVRYHVLWSPKLVFIIFESASTVLYWHFEFSDKHVEEYERYYCLNSYHDNKTMDLVNTHE